MNGYENQVMATHDRHYFELWLQILIMNLICGYNFQLLHYWHHPKNKITGVNMGNGKRNIVKRLRFLEIQAQQLDQLLELKNLSFTDFIHALIAQEFCRHQPYVPAEPEVMVEGVKAKPIKAQPIRTATPFNKLDPAFLLELGRIGNNINQIAKSLNILCLSDHHDPDDFSFLSCLAVLERIEAELHAQLGELPVITRSEHLVERRKEQALRYVSSARISS